ncbi:hypothetical protein SAMN03080601_02869 [Alkalitalea saponilacus]|uniref:Uncharacterized protein n=1 Tax=Alkalitalea saponilacus TaxID=889453 RepID=A0A1T5HSU0_9BACT|nr:hypothetical protein SAMN03080601_02869 [Alkalitalea saponilacus]
MIKEFVLRTLFFVRNRTCFFSFSNKMMGLGFDSCLCKYQKYRCMIVLASFLFDV